jgi:hypothetical protein
MHLERVTMHPTREETVRRTSLVRRVAGAVVVACVLAASGGIAAATQASKIKLSNTEREVAWALEAEAVARELLLGPEETTQLVAAYKSSRKAQGNGWAMVLMQAAKRDAQPQEAYNDMLDMQDAEAVKLQKSLEKFLPARKAAEAVESLGTYHLEWDDMAAIIGRCKLAPEEQQKALTLVKNYVIETNPILEIRFPDPEVESNFRKVQAASARLHAALIPLLSAEQAAEWEKIFVAR